MSNQSRQIERDIQRDLVGPSRLVQPTRYTRCQEKNALLAIFEAMRRCGALVQP